MAHNPQSLQVVNDMISAGYLRLTYNSQGVECVERLTRPDDSELMYQLIWDSVELIESMRNFEKE